MDGGFIDEDDFARAFARDGRFRTIYLFARGEADNGEIEPAAVAAYAREAAVNGDVMAQLGWGHLLLKGYGVARDPAAALRWFGIAARDGNAEAANMVGRCHENGWGTHVDLAESARWYLRAAEAGDAWAQFNLASLLAQGRGVAPDAASALTLLVRSARQGNPKAMNMLGRYREGGGHVSPERALRSAAGWYRRAAHGGCFRGQYHHARLLQRSGRIREAGEWYRASLAHAPEDFCRDALNELRSYPNREIQEHAQSGECR